MASGGVTSRNTRQGFRSEYIVKYIFSAFGTAVDVSAENDLGLDLICNLTSFEGQLIVYKSTYGIQVKSKGTPFTYRGKQATTWLSKLEFPILLVEVDKASSTIKVYSTWNLSRFLLGQNSDEVVKYPEVILFDTSDTEELMKPDCISGLVPVGKPILEFSFQDIDDSEKCENLYQVLGEWLEMDNKNYSYRRAGVSTVFGYTRWETNRKPSEFHVWYKPYFYSPHHNENIMKLLSEVWPVLGLYHKHCNNNQGIEPFKTTFNDLLTFASKHLFNRFGEFERGIFDKEL